MINSLEAKEAASRASCLNFTSFLGRNLYASASCICPAVDNNAGNSWGWENRMLGPKLL